MKKLLRNFKKKTSILLGGLTTSFIIAQNKVYAASGTESIDSFINCLRLVDEDPEES